VVDDVSFTNAAGPVINCRGISKLTIHHCSFDRVSNSVILFDGAVFECTSVCISNPGNIPETVVSSAASQSHSFEFVTVVRETSRWPLALDRGSVSARRLNMTAVSNSYGLINVAYAPQVELGEVVLRGNADESGINIVVATPPNHGLDTFIYEGATFIAIAGPGDYLVTRTWLSCRQAANAAGGAAITFVDCVVLWPAMVSGAALESWTSGDGAASPLVYGVALGNCATNVINFPEWKDGARTYVQIIGFCLAGAAVGVLLFLALWRLWICIHDWIIRRRDKEFGFEDG
jgi:hypothetical protein